MKTLNPELLKMSEEEFAQTARFSFELFARELAKSSGKDLEVVRKEAGAPPLKRTSRDIWRKVVCDGKTCGYGWIKLGPNADEAFAYEIFLEEAYRGMGLGRKVINLATEMMFDLGVRKLRLCVFENNSNARGLYESLGFKTERFDEKLRQAHMRLDIPQKSS